MHMVVVVAVAASVAESGLVRVVAMVVVRAPSADQLKRGGSAGQSPI